VIKKIVLSNFRSLGERVAIELGPLTALVGVNGSGKSSVADAIQFVADCLNRGLDAALTDRGGLAAIQRAGSGPSGVSVHIEVENDQGKGFWTFVLGDDPDRGYQVLEEHAQWSLLGPRALGPSLHRQGDVIENDGVRYDGAPPTDHRARLALTQRDQFGGLKDELRHVVIYKIFPNRLREAQHLDFTRPMREHGENWASILQRFDKDDAGRYFLAGLGQIVGDLDDYRTTAVGGYVIPEFRHTRTDGTSTWLGASVESDGTLRVAGILAALLQEPPLTLIGFEEPELTVHPGAIGVLFDHFRAASARGQVLLTTHSSELLDLLDIDEIRVVERRDGRSTVSRVDEGQRSLVRKKLVTTSELVWSEGLRAATGTDG
jgi:predicted ATPase